MFKTLDKMRRASLETRKRFAATVTITAVAVITLIWFVFFALSLARTGFKMIPDTATTTSASAAGAMIKPPFSE